MSDFMRQRRPELFSDSLSRDEVILDRAVLETFLDTLTSREQEKDFERFAKRLCELEICPNLKPQTGPSGGGDGKIDGLTYPVESELALRTYWGSSVKPAAEKKWGPKVRSDVAGAVSTNRGYTKIFFVTNQPVRAKIRMQFEEELLKKHGVQVEILDRTWILERVFTNRREEVALSYLHIPHRGMTTRIVGPQDHARDQALDRILKKLATPETYDGDDYAIAVDYLDAAKLARSVERSRHEVEGLFIRARDLAQKCGSTWLSFRSGYQHAWTALFWFDDPHKASEIYGALELLIDGAGDTYDFELLGNLWRVLSTAVRTAAIAGATVNLQSRLEFLRRNLERLASERGRPNNALHPTAELHMLQLVGSIGDAKGLEEAIQGLRECLRKSSGLSTFPVMAIIEPLTELGTFLGELPGYTELFSEMEVIAEKRFGEIARGKMLLQRGEQLLETNVPEALRSFGAARLRLAKEETEDLHVQASLGCVIAYGMLGLHWASRMEALYVVHAAVRTNDAWSEHGPAALLALRRLGWTDLRLGRIAPFLTWNSTARSFLSKLESEGYETSAWTEDVLVQEGALGCIVLNSTDADVKALSPLRSAFANAGMPVAYAALAYASGDSDEARAHLPKDFFGSDTIDDVMRMLKQQPVAQQGTAPLGEDILQRRRLNSTTLGVSFSVECPNEAAPLILAENMIAIWEAVLASAEWQNLAFIVESIEVRVVQEKLDRRVPQLQPLEPHRRDRYVLRCGTNLGDWLKSDNREQVSQFFMSTLLVLLLDATIDPLEDVEAELKRWHTQDTFSRALGLPSMALAIADLAGDRYELDGWQSSAS